MSRKSKTRSNRQLNELEIASDLNKQTQKSVQGGSILNTIKKVGHGAESIISTTGKTILKSAN